MPATEHEALCAQAMLSGCPRRAVARSALIRTRARRPLALRLDEGNYARSRGALLAQHSELLFDRSGRQ
eukprot:8227854-Alexandrium_andersonii.AAC.1